MFTFVIYIPSHVHQHGYSHALPYSGALFVYSSTPTIMIHIPVVLSIVFTYSAMLTNVHSQCRVSVLKSTTKDPKWHDGTDG